jgi:hypothetical protein
VGTEGTLLEVPNLRNTPMALPHEDNRSPRDGTTGLQYKFQGSSATVTYSRSKSGAYLANSKRIALNRQPVKSTKKLNGGTRAEGPSHRHEIPTKGTATVTSALS